MGGRKWEVDIDYIDIYIGDGYRWGPLHDGGVGICEGRRGYGGII